MQFRETAKNVHTGGIYIRVVVLWVVVVLLLTRAPCLLSSLCDPRVLLSFHLKFHFGGGL